MQTHIRNHVAALFLMLPTAVAFVVLPATAVAQPAAPELRSVEISADGDLDPGSRLSIRVVGTPRGQARLRIGGVRESIALREVRPGVYIGRYTIKRRDRIDDDSQVRAILRSAGRTAAADYTITDAMSGSGVAASPQAVLPPLPPQQRIDRFTMAAIDRIEPGSELRFALDGPPSASVLVDLPGVANDVALREIRPGHYEGGYTMRRSDNLNPSRPIVATLRVGGRVVTANLAAAVMPPSPDNRPPNVVNLTPREGDVVPGGPSIQIAANFDDRGGSGVDPASVRIILSGRDITPDAQINPKSFNYRASLPPGRHTVTVTARDRAGNTLRRDWSFDVSSVAPINVPIQVLNHSNNGTVVGSSTVIQGRTAPFASVAVRVEATAPLGGGGVAKLQIHSETLQADANGNFSFTFSPTFPVPGTRYEIDLVSTKANVTSEGKLVLFQRQG
ncbi:MAG: hypothetical protein ABIW85_06380 [Variovorax sp.]